MTGKVKSHSHSKPSKEQLGVTDNWFLVEGKYQNRPVFVRLNGGVREMVAHPSYGSRLGISIPFTAAQDGLPTSEENSVLSTVEELFVRELETDAESVFVAAVTTNSHRQLVFYSRDAESAKQRAKKILDHLRSYTADLQVHPDSSWSFYRSFEAA